MILSKCIPRNFLGRNLFQKYSLKSDVSLQSVVNNTRHMVTSPASKLENKVLESFYGEIDHEEITLTDRIFQDASQWADKPAITCGASGRSYNYGTLMMMIERCAKALITQLRLSPGDRIGIILPNLPEFPIVLHGALKAGLVTTFTNPLYSPEEICHQFKDCNVKAIVTIEMLMPVAMKVSKHLHDYKGTISIGGNDDKVQGIHSLQSLLICDEKTDLPKVYSHDTCMIPYSSGTTGPPKGVHLTHKNVVSHNKQVSQPVFMVDNGARGKGRVTLVIPPFYHIYGLSMSQHFNLHIGDHVICLPRFTPESYIKALEKYKPQTLFVVPALLSFLTGDPAVRKEHLESTRTVGIGAAQLTKSVVEKFLLKFGKSEENVAIVNGYGMTETSPVLLMTPQRYSFEKVGTIGHIVPSTQIKIVSTTTGEELGPNQPGEILAKGPQVMKGYWNNEAATRETIDSEGWLHTGDVAYYDEDKFFYIVDRTKELMKVKGFQVSPSELENLILTQPEVADVAVVGVPHEAAGEVPKAYIVLKPNQKVTEQQICDVVAKNTVKYKHLAGGVQFIDTIPRNASGKIMRKELKSLHK